MHTVLQVLSFCNLTMEELSSAVDMFCAFIDRNTYALFYYNGHAIGHGNDVYLVSKDTDFQVKVCNNFQKGISLKSINIRSFFDLSNRNIICL